MKTIAVTIMVSSLFWQTDATAQRMTENHTFIGKVRSMAFGFYGETAVALQGGACRGSEIVFLKTSNPNYDRIVAMLMTAVSSGQMVKLARLEDSIDSTTGSCVIGEAALGDWPAWN